MDEQLATHSPEFQSFILQVETALIKSADEARRLAEQTGTKLITSENFEQANCDIPGANSLPQMESKEG